MKIRSPFVFSRPRSQGCGMVAAQGHVARSEWMQQVTYKDRVTMTVMQAQVSRLWGQGKQMETEGKQMKLR